MINIVKKNSVVIGTIVVVMFIVGIAMASNKEAVVTSSGSIVDLSNKKIEWGIKRNDNHEQPDLGAKNKQLLESYDGIAMGNKESKKIYLTFDEGYEAGYTSKILDILKENNVTATFFITAHYLNSKPDLVKQMIDEGHIVRESYSKS